MNDDVLIIGAGPAGMAAALALDTAGARVRVVEEQPAAGGQVYRAVQRVQRERPEQLPLYGPDYARGLDISRQFDAAGIEISYTTSVWDISVENGVPSIGLLQGDNATIEKPRHIILATGAMERPTPFPGWTLPGVMTVGAAQTLYKESALLPDSPPVIVGTGPLVYLFVKQMLDAGMKPALILDTGPKSVDMSCWGSLLSALSTDFSALYKGWSWLREINQAGIERITGINALKAHGRSSLQSIEYRHNGKTHQVSTDLLLAHDGVIPNNHLTMAAGCEQQWNKLQHYWQPICDDQGLSSQAGISLAGDCAGIKGAEAAQCSGRVVGWQVAAKLGLVDQLRYQQQTIQERKKLKRIAVIRKFLDQHYHPFDEFQTPKENDTTVCRCEQVSVAELREVAAMGCMGPNQAKAFTRCGMGPCMGRLCGNTVSQLFAKYHDKTVSEIGHYRIRPPVRPLTLKQLSNLDLGE